MPRSGRVRITKKLHTSDRATICAPLFALGADITSNVTPIHMTKTLSVSDSVSAHEFQLKIGPDKEYNKIKTVKTKTALIPATAPLLTIESLQKLRKID